MPLEDEVDNFAAFRRKAKKVRAKLPRGIKLRLKNKRKAKWFRKKRQWRKKYNDYLDSAEWKAKRQQRLDKCGNTCEYCKTAPAVHVHHVTYERVFNEDIDDLRGICLDCHESIHGRRLGWKKKRKKKRKVDPPSGTKEVEF